MTPEQKKAHDEILQKYRSDKEYMREERMYEIGVVLLVLVVLGLIALGAFNWAAWP